MGRDSTVFNMEVGTRWVVTYLEPFQPGDIVKVVGNGWIDQENSIKYVDLRKIGLFSRRHRFEVNLRWSNYFGDLEEA